MRRAELERRLEIVPIESDDVDSWCKGMQSSDCVVFASGAPEAGEAFSGEVPSEVLLPSAFAARSPNVN